MARTKDIGPFDDEVEAVQEEAEVEAIPVDAPIEDDASIGVVIDLAAPAADFLPGYPPVETVIRTPEETAAAEGRG